ncbi:origin recognition complex subunit orc5 [Phlyctema vagabunda]|uniref:Origin recognition complex subunit orc5 n=1 Tax=Phlyctema vagabunda TaxID=108571 RepID=A0ABR4PD95_9HELO
MPSLFTLPHELLVSAIATRFPGRDAQIRTLATLLSAAPSRNIVLHGLEATGKTAICDALLSTLSDRSKRHNGHTGRDTLGDLRYAIIRSRECITGRHLLEQTVGAVAKAVEYPHKVARCENLAQLVVEIGRLLDSWSNQGTSQGRFVLVFDNVDQQKEAPATLLPALARLGEIIPNLTTIFIVTSPRPHFLHLPGVPHIKFPTYTKSEALKILSSTNPSPQLPDSPEETKGFWNRFCSAVWDSLAKHSGRDIISFRTLCLRLWPAFVAPVLDDTYSAKEFGRVLVFKRSLFQDEKLLVPSIASHYKSIEAVPKRKQQAIGTQLPYFSRILLVAAYLASFNRPVTDQLHFMKGAAAKRRKKGGGTALSRDQHGVAKSRKISRKLLGPQAFILERMLAIFHAIKSDADDRNRVGGGKRRGRDGQAGDADIQMAIATLASLRLLVKVGAANSADTLESGSKWRVAVGWDFARSIARSVGIEAEDYLAD